MRRSPRRPLILRRRKLPFHQNDSPAGKTQSPSGASSSTEELPGAAATKTFPSGIHILDHPSRSDTQVVVIPKTANLQSVIGALTVKGKESGTQGPNKFILLGANDSPESGSSHQPAAEGGGVSRASAVDQQVKTDAKPLAESKTRKFFPNISNLTALI